MRQPKRKFRSRNEVSLVASVLIVSVGSCFLLHVFPSLAQQMSIPGLNEVKKVKETFLPGPSTLPKFGYSSAPSQEMNCESILVLMQCQGQLMDRRRRARLPPASTIRQAKEDHFEKNMEQKLVVDENNFCISEQDLDRPLWQFSNKCCLVLSFQYETHLEGLSIKTNNLKDAATNYFWPPKL